MPFIAELGVNHLGNFDRAVEMVDKAIEGGSDFLKLQTYNAADRYEKSNPKYEEFTKLLTDWQLSKEEETKLWQYGKSKKQIYLHQFMMKRGILQSHLEL